MRVGILGGTFDPIHFGHLVIAQEALEKLRLRRVIFMPSYLPPHKSPQNITPAALRLKMVNLAVKSNSKFSSSALEIERKGRSYSVETLRQLTDIFGKRAKLFFITGSDSIEELMRWKDIAEILKLARLVIGQRPHYPIPSKNSPLLKKLSTECLPKRAQAAGKGIQFIDITSLDVSSSQIRRNLKDKKSVRYLIPEEVRKFILKNKLYR